MPKIVGNAFVFGEVKARVRYRVLRVFIAIAPLVWWVALFFMLKHILPAYVPPDMHCLETATLLEKMKSLSFRDVFPFWLAFQLFWAGRLSVEDMKTCLSGIFSPSGLLLISVLLLSRFII